MDSVEALALAKALRDAAHMRARFAAEVYGLQQTCEKAADHIEAISSENERLRKALEPFARLSQNYEGLPSSDAVFARGCVYVSDIRRARAVLSGGQSR